MRLFILCGLLLSALLAYAQAWHPASVRDDPKAFLEGVLVGILIHEAGHALVATVEGYDVGVQGVTIVYPDAQMTPNDHLQVASAGIQTQWVLSEYVLRRQEARGPEAPISQYRAGLVMSHVLITAAYITVLKDHEDGDLLAISSETGLSTDELALMIAVPAALDYWRLTGKNVPRWVPAVSAGLKGVGLTAVWAF